MKLFDDKYLSPYHGLSLIIFAYHF